MNDSGIDQLNLDLIKEPHRVSASSANKKDYKDANLSAEKQAHLDQDIRDRELDREQREKYARCTFKLMCCWLGFTALVLFMDGFRWGYYEQTDKIIISLLTASAANVIGLFAVVNRYVFRSKR